MIEKLRTGWWFLRRPACWSHAVALVGRKLTNAARYERDRPHATAWAAERAVSAGEALTRIGLFDGAIAALPRVPGELIEDAGHRARSASVKMGGPADLDLLYATVRLSRPRSAVETGVAYGWSSLVILAAMAENGGGVLVSVDMPYVKRNNEAWVGVVVPESLRPSWRLIREPDRRGVDKAIAACGGDIDHCHYDSDKSYPGRNYAYARLWRALRPGGVFISDDIQDNFAFRDLFTRHGLEPQITHHAN